MHIMIIDILGINKFPSASLLQPLHHWCSGRERNVLCTSTVSLVGGRMKRTDIILKQLTSPL